jgi:hypothetical protein
VKALSLVVLVIWLAMSCPVRVRGGVPVELIRKVRLVHVAENGDNGGHTTDGATE